MNNIETGLRLALDYLQGIPATSWYALGVLLGSIPVVIGIVAWIKRKHLRSTGEKLASEFIVLNVGFWGAIMTVANFVVTQGSNFAPFLPFFSKHWAQISAGAIAVHAVSTALHKWWDARQNNKVTGLLDKDAETIAAVQAPAELMPSVPVTPTPPQPPVQPRPAPLPGQPSTDLFR